MQKIDNTPELSTDECLAILDENIRFANEVRKNEIQIFNNNFSFKMPEKYSGCITVKATGKQFNFNTYRGMRAAFTKASRTEHFNQYIVAPIITGELYW